MTRRGFTLIELSIVLVILGLIVGGIVGGRSLVRSAELQAVATEINGIQTAINAFEMQYDELPGDFYEAMDYWSGVSRGDGDGFIEYGGSNGWADREYRTMWEHLNAAEIIPGSMSGAAYNAPAQIGLTCLGSKTGGCYSVYTWGVAPNVPLYTTREGPVITLGGLNGVDILAEGGLFFAKEARSIDLKMDDGDADEGRFVGRREYNDGDHGDGCVDGDWDDATADYDLDDTTNLCQIQYFFR